MASIRKAIAAAIGAGISAALPLALDAAAGGLTPDEAGGVAAAFVTAAAAVGYATWLVRNAPARNGRHEAPEAPQ